MVREITRRGVLWLGLRCDVRCKFCYDDRVSAADKVWLSYEEATEALAKFRRFYANEYVDFMGGEPTLHPRILEIVGYSAGIGLRPTIITHGMHLSDFARAKAYADAGIHDFLVSIHAIGDRVSAIHGRGKNNFERQMAALDNLRTLGVPFRFNCTLIKDNLDQLEAIAELAGRTGARVVNFLMFNPYFEWSSEGDIPFQARHSEIAPQLTRAIDRCTELGVEANVRYMPICQLPGRESHVYTGYQLPYDVHEWDYNSWYDAGRPGRPSAEWYLEAAQRQQRRHHYSHVAACDPCAVKAICDGFHQQYVARWGSAEASPYAGDRVTDPRHFIAHQVKVTYDDTIGDDLGPADTSAEALAATQFSPVEEHRAGVKAGMPHTRRS